jgi:hypothetical protein
MLTIPAPILVKTFPSHFSTFSIDFDTFTQSASRALGSVNPTQTLKYQATSSLAQYGKALELSWWDCFLEIQAMDETGSSSLVSAGDVRFREVFELLRRADQIFRVNRSVIENASSEFCTPELEPLVLMFQKMEQLFKGPLNIEGEVGEANQLTRLLFDRAVPMFFKQPSELSWCRGQLLAKCAEIRECNRAILEFETIIRALKSNAARFQLDLQNVFEVLNLPFAAAVRE